MTFHLSGGTSELLLVSKKKNEFECEIVGGTKDLPAGQFIDRIGVKLGMEFPCGKYMDYSAMNFAGKKPKVKTCVEGEFFNLSGEETRYSRLIEKGADPDEIAYCVMTCVAESVRKAVESAKERFGVRNVLMVGGVSSSKMLRAAFEDVPQIYFAAPELSTDNAVGVCEIGARWTE